MSIERSTAIGYGIVVDEDVIHDIEKRYESEQEYLDVYDEYFHVIDAWTGGDYFIGLTSEIGEDGTATPINPNELFFSPSDIKKFENDILPKFNDLICWKDAQLHVIGFVY
jgi:hypothetical protein